jgi:hypothetical protein
MVFARMQFDWQKFKPPATGMTFAFFFKPILPRLAPCYWVADYWPLRTTAPGVADALNALHDDITPPRVILPKFADELVGDRDQFFGFLKPPVTANAFDLGLHAAGARDEDEWRSFVRGPIGSKEFEQGQRRYLRHLAEHGSHRDRYLEEAGVQFAFMTNDTVWWIAARDPEVLPALQSYARGGRGIVFQQSVSFGT